MPLQNETVEPTPFEPQATSGQTSDSNQDTASHSAALLWGGFALLAAAVLAVFLWLPNQLSPTEAPQTTAHSSPQQPDSKSTQTPGTNRPENSVQPEEKTPWADAQQARLRLAAQDTLAALIDLQFALEEKGAASWAAVDFSRAAELAKSGDLEYRQQAYASANELYGQSVEILQGLSDTLPERLETLLQEIESALQSGDRTLASEAYDAAFLIEPDHAQLESLATRLQQLPELMSLLAQARDAESIGELESARELLQAAITLDPLNRASAQALDRVNTKITDQTFQALMSQGYKHLTNNKPNQAIEAFTSAEALKPGSAEATSAIREANNAKTAANLLDLKNRGTRYERAEQWDKAVAQYERALEIDGNVLFAVEGLARSKQRASLASGLLEILQAPDRLADQKVLLEAEDFLRQAKRVSPRGPVLQSQLAELEKLLSQARQPVAVTLQSDTLTEIVVYKVGRLGKFVEKEITLRPGSYTAVGTRNGYRDVRQTFTVRHSAPDISVTLICTEPI